MAEQWIIRVQGKEYGPADLATLREWKADGRVLPANPARQADVDPAAVAGSAKEALWKTAGDIPGLFRIEPPPVQGEARNQRSAAYAQSSGVPTEVGVEKWASKPPSRNILVETFRIYFRGFFQFFCLSLLSSVPFLCDKLTSHFVNTVPGLNIDLRNQVAGAFEICMFVLWIVLIPIYIAGIQILAAELATGHGIGFFSALNGAVKYWPRVAGLGLLTYVIFFLLIIFGVAVLLMMLAAAVAGSLFSIVIALGLATLQIWLFCRFFVFVLFWQQFAVLENLTAFDALRESSRLAQSGRDLRWNQRPLWRGAFIVSLWIAFALAIAIVAIWPRLTANWPLLQDFSNQLSVSQDPQVVLQKLMASLPKDQGASLSEIGFSVLQRILQPLLGIAFVVLYFDSRQQE
jgi:hypothetical protein